MNPEIIGLMAGVATSVASLPQAIKTIKTGQTRGLSLWTYLVLNLGLGLWIVYGIQLRSPSLILANGISLLPNGAILFLVARGLWSKRRNR